MNTLDSVVDALAKDPARKFIIVEQVRSTTSPARTCSIASDPRMLSALDFSSFLSLCATESSKVLSLL